MYLGWRFAFPKHHKKDPWVFLSKVEAPESAYATNEKAHGYTVSISAFSSSIV